MSTSQSTGPLLRALGAALLCMIGAALVWAQPTGISPLSPPPNAPERADSTWHALVNATVHVRPGETLENAVVVLRDGMIIAVEAGRGGEPPQPPSLPAAAAGARVWDATGLHVYPGFIDAHVEVSVPSPAADSPGVHWNARVMPQRSALDGTGVDRRTAESLRRLGFTAAGISPRGGIFRGTGAVVSLAAPPAEASADRPPVYRERTWHAIAFDTARRRRSEPPDVQRWSTYPNSLMGAIALIRQTLSDADWQHGAREQGVHIAANALDHLAAPQPPAAHRTPRPTDERLTDDLLLAALAHEAARRGSNADNNSSGSGEPRNRRERREERGSTSRAARPADAIDRGLPLLFDTSDELDALRAARIAREFNRPAVILGSGQEFRRLSAIVADGLPIVLPLRFARLPDVGSVGRADAVELRDLMMWEQAPTNPRRLDAAGLTVALTTSKLRNRNEFHQNLTSAIQHGLPAERALAMLTTHPAELLGVSDRLGTIEVGKVANLVVADGLLLVGFAEDDGPASADAESAGDADAPRDDEDPGEADRAPARGRILDVWIDGNRHIIRPVPRRDLVGTWQVSERDGRRIDAAAPDAVTITITRENRVTLRREDTTVRAVNVSVQENRIDWAVDGAPFDVDAMLLDTAAVEDDHLHGTTKMPSGRLVRWTARRVEEPAPYPPPKDQADEHHEPDPSPNVEGFAGVWHVTMEDQPDQEITVEVSPELAVSIFVGGQHTLAQNVVIEDDAISFRFDSTLLGVEGFTTVQATRDGDALRGQAELGGAAGVGFTAVREPGPAPEEAADAPRARRGVVGRAPRAADGRDAQRRLREAIAEVPEHYGYPFGPYMLTEQPEQKPTLFINATLWTASDAGIIEDGWMYIAEGRIAALGSGDPPQRYLDGKVVDVKGRHIAPGIIDCHSHTGISRGVNESGRAISAEVRIGDVTNPDAVSWYRQLAGGVTTVNSLHGSANPIGGQSQTNKIRWGAAHPDEMHMEGAKPGIKFALGENVKQSNWGDHNTVRYPQTRMGVETIIRDRLKAAREYMNRAGDADHGSARSSLPAPSAALPPRRDLELEALAEVLAGERLVHCHSYRQDEILMLCRIADEFDFTIGTFQHILEGYKVADEVARHAIGASAFSDWWAYKVEVQDAIPQAGPIMWEQGVVVSFNSDSDELARRMNGEAAKAIKYASPEHPIEPNEALKFVTLNAAIQLGIEDRVGSLEVGKDADFAIWSGPPLSSLSRAEATYVDGRRLFSLDDDRKHREFIQRERERLLQKALAEHRRRPATARGQDREGRREPEAEDSPRRAMLRAMYLDMLNRGVDPSAARPGVCGCDEAEFHLHW